MILITSAAYISPGLASEFGKLPPCMLPVQNKRLYEHQLSLIPEKELIILSLPQSFQLKEFDKNKLDIRGVHIVFVPDDLSLGASIVYVLNVVARYEEVIHILHGDTLFEKLPDNTDVCLVSKAEDDYSWAEVDSRMNKNVYAGYFSFFSQSLLIQKITEHNYNFILGVEAYNNIRYLEKIEVSYWLDFGLVNSYYRSTSKMTTQRFFNTLKVNSYSVTKCSRDNRKILAEANWFNSLPKGLKHYAPALWNFGVQEDKAFYEIEYYYLSSLANLFVFGKNPVFVWEEIIKACANFINDIAQYNPEDKDISKISIQNDRLYAPKTLKRLEEYSRQRNISLNHSWVINGVQVPSLLEIVEETDRMINKNDERFVKLMHGDFCFSNILYDFKSKTIRVIDPRGLDLDGNYSIYGDIRYDVAKLSHSILGLYDFIIGGFFTYSEKDAYNIILEFEKESFLNAIQENFRHQHFAGYSLMELNTYPILVHLFLSMLPLHKDDALRQKVMLANALRLYVEFKQQP